MDFRNADNYIETTQGGYSDWRWSTRFSGGYQYVCVHRLSGGIREHWDSECTNCS